MDAGGIPLLLHRIPLQAGYYLSLEFLMGRTLGNAMLNPASPMPPRRPCMGWVSNWKSWPNPRSMRIGNGGLGRLAACFLTAVPHCTAGHGFGIPGYEYGMFRQRNRGWTQIEEPDHWLRDGNPWEQERPEFIQRVRFGGRTEQYRGQR